MRFLIVLLALASCSDEKKSPDAASLPKDAAVDAKVVDAPPDAQAFVLKVDCATVTPDATVTTEAGAYKPTSVTIATNGVVKFTPEAIHNVAPDTTQPTDPGLQVGFGATVCLRFTKPGAFNFLCTPHQFKGVVNVNP